MATSLTILTSLRSSPCDQELTQGLKDGLCWVEFQS